MSVYSHWCEFWIKRKHFLHENQFKNGEKRETIRANVNMWMNELEMQCSKNWKLYRCRYTKNIKAVCNFGDWQSYTMVIYQKGQNPPAITLSRLSTTRCIKASIMPILPTGYGIIYIKKIWATNNRTKLDPNSTSSSTFFYLSLFYFMYILCILCLSCFCFKLSNSYQGDDDN